MPIANCESRHYHKHCRIGRNTNQSLQTHRLLVNRSLKPGQFARRQLARGLISCKLTFRLRPVRSLPLQRWWNAKMEHRRPVIYAPNNTWWWRGENATRRAYHANYIPRCVISVICPSRENRGPGCSRPHIEVDATPMFTLKNTLDFAWKALNRVSVCRASADSDGRARSSTLAACGVFAIGELPTRYPLSASDRRGDGTTLLPCGCLDP